MTNSTIFKDGNEQFNIRGDTNFCAPLALAILTGRDPIEVAKIMEANGHRKINQGVQTHAILKQAKDFNLELIDRTTEIIENGGKSVISIINIVDISKHYLVGVRGHVLAIINGEVHDWTNDRKHRISKVWEVRDGELGILNIDHSAVKADELAKDLSVTILRILRENYNQLERPWHSVYKSGAECRIVWGDGTCYLRKSRNGYTLQYSLHNAYWRIAPKHITARKTSQYANYELDTLEKAIDVMCQSAGYWN